VQQAARLATTIDGRTLQTIIDLAGERLCMPGKAHICKARDVFARPSVPGTVEIARLAFDGLDDNDVLVLTDEDRRVAVRDFAGGPRRDIIVDYPSDGGLGPRPCIATIDGAQSPGDLRLHLTGRLLEPGAVVHPDAVAVAVHLNGHAAIVDPGGVDIVTSLDPTGDTSPVRLGRTEIDGVSAVTWLDDRLVVATGEDLVELDVASGAKPHRLAAPTANG
jgi:hypothetical protein